MFEAQLFYKPYRHYLVLLIQQSIWAEVWLSNRGFRSSYSHGVEASLACRALF